ncbi:MAG: MBL fold metallo-hydrolase [Verrucomicrobiales bacterium]|nr:MBL fold metallo-hydrolase [Verrucomicrobiales bacterium]
MFFTSLANPDEIGSHSYLFELGGTRVILDAGIHPKKAGYTTLPAFDLIEQDSVDGIIISHAHLDHLGSLPVLFRNQRHAAVVMTEPTAELGKALLHNSVNVMKAQKAELGVIEYPFFSHRELDEMYKFWLTRRPGQQFRIENEHDTASESVVCEMFFAGHVLGAVGVQMKCRDRTIFYTGDVHFEDQTLSRGADFPESGIDTLIIETTRGDHARDPDYTREAERNRMGEAAAAALNRGGSVLIPVFALGKTQEVVLMLHELMQAGILPGDTPIHIGGLSTKMTHLVDKLVGRWPRGHEEIELLADLPNLRLLEKGSVELNCQPGRIYCYSSGMMTEHTVSHRFAPKILSDERNALLFVGYADPDSPAGRIQSGNSEFPVRCPVERFDFSGHAPRDQLLDYIRRVNPKRVILVHGDAPARAWFADQLADSEMEVMIPETGKKINLD